ncbi:MAG: hypothetical protein HYU04_00485 [Candidatus Wildermuthbacteria bacterium]|nr:hypothetical protein [Candidatus Wildermuthbacteria bacterium]
MSNNTLLVLCIIGSIVIGAFAGYFAFVQIFKEQFAQQDRVTLENFESASVVLRGTVVEIGDGRIVLERNDVRFPVLVSNDTLILVPDKAQEERLTQEKKAQLMEAGRPIVKEGGLQDIAINQTAEVVAQYFPHDSTFQASRIVIPPYFKDAKI